MMTATLALILLFSTANAPSLPAVTQAPSAIGRWQVDFTFTDTVSHVLRFDAEDAGKGTYLLLDRRSSLLEPPETSKAEWTESVTDGKLTISGPIEFPIGNVGRDPGMLVFTGAFDTADSITGAVAFFRFVQDSKDVEKTPSKTGTFRATRITGDVAPRVQLLSPSSGKLKRGQGVDISWIADSIPPIALQQVFLSLDNGESYTPISAILNETADEFAWIVPESLPKTKKARLKIVVVNTIGSQAEDISKRKLKIK